MEQKEKKGPTEAELNQNFTSLLKEFENLWESSPKAMDKFDALKQKAKLKPMYPRQMDAVIARCNNVLNGMYGNTKKAENYEQSKASK
jgi:hypothetical protein